MNFDDERSAPESGKRPSIESVSPKKPSSFFQERPPQVTEVAPQLLRKLTGSVANKIKEVGACACEVEWVRRSSVRGLT